MYKMPSYFLRKIIFLIIFSTNIYFLNAANIKQVDIQIVCTEDEKVNIGLIYKLLIEPQNESKLAIKALSHKAIKPQNIKAHSESIPLQIAFVQNEGLLMEGILDLSTLTHTDTLAHISISYEIFSRPSRNNEWELIIPIVIVNAKPLTIEPNTLQIDLSIKNEWKIAEVFPITDFHLISDDTLNQYKMNLQAIPSWLSYKLYKGDTAPLSPIFWVDLLVISLLIIIGSLVWRQLK